LGYIICLIVMVVFMANDPAFNSGPTRTPY